MLDMFILDQKRTIQLEFPFDLPARFLTILQKPLLNNQQNIGNIIEVFPILIWFLTILSLVIFVTLNILSSSYKPKTRILLDYIGLILSQSLSATNYHNKISLITWLISLFFLTFLFKNDLLSNIMALKYSIISDLDDLINKNLMAIIEEQRYAVPFIKQVHIYNSISLVIHIFCLKNMPELYTKLVLVKSGQVHSEDTITSLLNERKVILSDEITNQLFTEYYKPFGLIHTNGIDSFRLHGYPFNRNLDKKLKRKLIKW